MLDTFHTVAAELKPTDDPPIRICVVGNQCSYGYRLMFWLRQFGHAANLVLVEGADDHQRDQIASIDARLADDIPKWVQQFKRLDDRFGKMHQHFDIVITLGPIGVKVARLIEKVPIVHLAMGSDIFELPLLYQRSHIQCLESTRAVIYRLFRSKPARRRRAVGIGVWRSLDRISAILADFNPILETARRVNLLDKIRIWPFPEDVRGNQKRVDRELLQRLNLRYQERDLVLIWLNRINFDNHGSGHRKGAEHFLEALTRLIGDGSNIRAIVGTHGDDIDEFQRIATERGLDKHVDYLQHMPFSQLLTYFSIDNAVVCDQICDLNCITGTVREALSVGANVVTGVDQHLMRISYADRIPVLVATDGDSCYHAVKRLLGIPREHFRARQQEIIRWAEDKLCPRAVIPRLIGILDEVVYLNRRRSSP